MKKLFYALMCALMVIALPSCRLDKDEDNIVPAEELLVGTWELQSYSYTEKENGAEISSGTQHVTNNWNKMLSLRADYTFTELDIEGDYTDERKGTWMSSSNTLILKYDENEYYDSYTRTYSILSISKTKVTLRSVSREIDNGATYECTYDFTYTKD